MAMSSSGWRDALRFPALRLFNRLDLDALVLPELAHKLVEFRQVLLEDAAPVIAEVRGNYETFGRGGGEGQESGVGHADGVGRGVLDRGVEIDHRDRGSLDIVKGLGETAIDPDQLPGEGGAVAHPQLLPGDVIIIRVVEEKGIEAALA